MKSLRTLVAVLLLWPALGTAGGFGWYYDSFSWEGLNAYFGRGTPQQKQVFRKHLRALVESERRESYFGFPETEAETRQWEQHIDKGLNYSGLSPEQTRVADQIINVVLNSDAGVEILKIRGETTPDFFHPET